MPLNHFSCVAVWALAKSGVRLIRSRPLALSRRQASDEIMKRKILFLSLLSFLQILLVHFFLLQGFANSGDEQAYLFQARVFARGQLYVEDPIYDLAHPLNKYVAADAMDDAGGRRFAKYAPGWPALLSLGTRLRVEWMVAPLLGALTVFLMLSYVRKRIGDEFVVAAWWLVTLCAFFLFSVANFGAHTATMVFLLGAFVLYDNARGDDPLSHSRWRLFGAGLLLGYCSLIRYLDWVPLMAWIAFDLLRRRRIKGVILVLLGFGLLASCNLLYNKLLTGNPFLPPFAHDIRNTGTRLGLSWQGFVVTGVRLARVLYALPPAVLLFWCLVRPCRSALLKACLTIFALDVTAYFFYPWGVAGPGPRYYFPYFPFLILAVVELYRLNRDQWISRGGWRVAMACLIVCSLSYGARHTFEIYRRRDLERAVATISQTRRIILVQSGTYKMSIPDLVRNPPDLWSADTLYFAYDNDGGEIADLLKRFPGHSVYLYRYPGLLRPWSR